jgi:hypothetical protein
LTSITTLPANGSGGRSRSARGGIAIATTSPKRAASGTVPARTPPPSETTTPASVSGPRELLSMTSWPAAPNRTASARPMWPAPTIPILIAAFLSAFRYEAATHFHTMCEGLANAELRGAILRILPEGDEERAWRDGLSTLVKGFQSRDHVLPR